MKEQQTTQQHLSESKQVLEGLESTQRYAQSEGRQSILPSNINQTITGLREYIEFVSNQQQLVESALKQQQPRSGSAGGQS